VRGHGATGFAKYHVRPNEPAIQTRMLLGRPRARPIARVGGLASPPSTRPTAGARQARAGKDLLPHLRSNVVPFSVGESWGKGGHSVTSAASSRRQQREVNRPTTDEEMHKGTSRARPFDGKVECPLFLSALEGIQPVHSARYHADMFMKVVAKRGLRTASSNPRCAVAERPPAARSGNPN